MPRQTHLARARNLQLAGAGWSHPYRTGPFDPFLYADGGDADASGSTDPGAAGQAADQGGDGSGASGEASGQQSAAPAGDSGADLAATVKRLERELHTARSEAGKARNQAKQQAADDAVKDITQKLGKALGLVSDDTPPDPAKLAEAISQKDAALTEREAALRAKDVELAVWTRADKAGARAAALLDSRAFVRTIGDLDPSDKTFTAALDDAIKTAVKGNPAFAVTPAATASGPDLSGGTREGSAKQRNGSLAGAIRSHYQT
ncbi:hypothetical protein ACIPY6_02915 [Streptomyces sp. NPDC090054]|uniref:hypothetical protein n=1 Tax=Streptomyces sp. NPDC090054 TaxID=3365933 RepID=UPI003807EE34